MKVAAMRRVYLREAAITLVLARLAVRFVPPARLFAWADRSPRRVRPSPNTCGLADAAVQ